ncbi:MAG: hypothetical protein QM759_03765 [Terricaulis sp.]
MRSLLPALALALVVSGQALAQDDPSPALQIAHASHTLAAIWRPITATTQSALTAACAGASDDLSALDAAMPQDLNNRTLAAVHVAHGLVFVPTSENPADTFVFADTSMSWLASGVAVIKSANEDTGEVTIEDAAGTSVQLLLGHVAGQVLMRLTTPSGQNLTFAGCASTLEPPGNSPG